MPDPTNSLFAAFAHAGQVLASGFSSFLANSAQTEGGFAAKPLSPDAARLEALQRDYLQRHLTLWQGMAAKDGNGDASPEAVTDRRFASAEWGHSSHYDYIRRAYLINADFVRGLAEALPVQDEMQRRRLLFLTRQYVDALSPANFAGTNPEFVNEAVKTGGKSIANGIENLLADMAKGRISITDDAAFEVGRNVAVSPGTVIFENELIQLIQYAPATPTVAQVPLLIIPPCINKFYILDLQPENSFVRFCVEQGMTVFMVSWRNPTEEQGRLGWDDYLEMGPLTAMKVVRDICGEPLNMVGWCVGGTILSSALAVAAGRGEALPKSLTLLTTLLDFSRPGDLGNFIDEASVAAREATLGKGGILPGKELAAVFSSLRPNDLVWPYVVSNYFKGNRPSAFDILYWNGDSTNLAGPFLAWYLRNMYLENNLRVPGKLRMCGVQVDVGAVDMPNYVLATREDHIVPWEAAYASTQLLGGPSTFVLGASGHIAGVINPASKNKRSYWVGETQPATAEAWLESAAEQKGSWWKHWLEWIKPHLGAQCAAPEGPGNGDYRPVEAAPGRYVKQKA